MSLNVAILDQDSQVINITIVNDDYVLNTNEIIYTDENPAFIGGDYVDGYFYPLQPYPSWTRESGTWQAPTPKPTDGKWYFWNESTLSWESSETAPE